MGDEGSPSEAQSPCSAEGKLRQACRCRAPRLSRLPGGGEQITWTLLHPPLAPQSSQQKATDTPNPSQPPCSRGGWLSPTPLHPAPLAPVHRSDRSGAWGCYCPHGWGGCSPSPEWPGKDPPTHPSQATTVRVGALLHSPHSAEGVLGGGWVEAGVDPAVVSWEREEGQ